MREILKTYTYFLYVLTTDIASFINLNKYDMAHSGLSTDGPAPGVVRTHSPLWSLRSRGGTGGSEILPELWEEVAGFTPILPCSEGVFSP